MMMVMMSLVLTINQGPVPQIPAPGALFIRSAGNDSNESKMSDPGDDSSGAGEGVRGGSPATPHRQR